MEAESKQDIFLKEVLEAELNNNQQRMSRLLGRLCTYSPINIYSRPQSKPKLVKVSNNSLPKLFADSQTKTQELLESEKLRRAKKAHFSWDASNPYEESVRIFYSIGLFANNLLTECLEEQIQPFENHLHQFCPYSINKLNKSITEKFMPWLRAFNYSKPLIFSESNFLSRLLHPIEYERSSIKSNPLDRSGNYVPPRPIVLQITEGYALDYIYGESIKAVDITDNEISKTNHYLTILISLMDKLSTTLKTGHFDIGTFVEALNEKEKALFSFPVVQGVFIAIAVESEFSIVNSLKTNEKHIYSMKYEQLKKRSIPKEGTYNPTIEKLEFKNIGTIDYGYELDVLNIVKSKSMDQESIAIYHESCIKAIQPHINHSSLLNEFNLIKSSKLKRIQDQIDKALNDPYYQPRFSFQKSSDNDIDYTEYLGEKISLTLQNIENGNEVDFSRSYHNSYSMTGLPEDLYSKIKKVIPKFKKIKLDVLEQISEFLKKPEAVDSLFEEALKSLASLGEENIQNLLAVDLDYQREFYQKYLESFSPNPNDPHKDISSIPPLMGDTNSNPYTHGSLSWVLHIMSMIQLDLEGDFSKFLSELQDSINNTAYKIDLLRLSNEGIKLQKMERFFENSLYVIEGDKDMNDLLYTRIDSNYDGFSNYEEAWLLKLYKYKKRTCREFELLKKQKHTYLRFFQKIKSQLLVKCNEIINKDSSGNNDYKGSLPMKSKRTINSIHAEFIPISDKVRQLRLYINQMARVNINIDFNINDEQTEILNDWWNNRKILTKEEKKIEIIFSCDGDYNRDNVRRGLIRKIQKSLTEKNWDTTGFKLTPRGCSEGKLKINLLYKIEKEEE